MNIEAKQYLQSLVIKDIHELTSSDIGFLKARITYLSPYELSKFSEVLKNKPETKDDELEQLKSYAKNIGMKGIHLFKDVNKLTEKIAEFESKNK